MKHRQPSQDHGMHDSTWMFSKKVEMHFITGAFASFDFKTLFPLLLEFIWQKRVKKDIPIAATATSPPPPHALAEDRKCLAARCHIIPACTVLARSVLCILSLREMEGRGANTVAVDAMFAQKKRSHSCSSTFLLLSLSWGRAGTQGAKLCSNCAGEVRMIASYCPLSPQVRVQKVFS